MGFTDNDLENVVTSVKTEIETMSSTTKKIHEDAQKNYHALKSALDLQEEKGNQDRQKIERLSADIATRQEELDKRSAAEAKRLNDRLDELEVSLQRPGIGIGSSGISVDQDVVKRFVLETMSTKGATTRARLEQKYTDGINPSEYIEYRKAFLDYLSGKGDERSMSPEAQKALMVGSDPDGGYTVTPAMSSMIIKRLFEDDPIRQLANVETITTDALEFLADWGNAGATWEGTETVAPGETSTPQLNKIRIPIHQLSARPRATQQLLEDSGINVEAWLADKVANRFMRAEGAAFVTGTGINQPRGFLTYGTGTGWGQVEQVNMGAAAALTTDGFINVKYHLNEYFLNRGTWLMNRTTVMAAMMLKDGDGAYIWKPGLTSDTNSTLLGLPVRMSTTMPAVAANALSVALADWREAYTIIDRLGITIQRDPYTVKPFVEFYTRKRVGGDVVNWDAIKIGVVHV